MITLKTDKSSVVSLVLVGSLVLLTGCWSKKNDDAAASDNQANSAQVAGKGDVLLTIDGKPVLYSEDFEDQKQMALQSNQQLNMILQMMPDAEYSMLFKSIEAGCLMKEWVVRNGIDQDPKKVKERRQFQEAVELQLYMKYFEDAHPIEVTEKEAEQFYKEKRDQIPGLIIAPASVDIVYVSFDSKAKAETFVAKVRDGSDKHFQLAAKESGVTVQNMTVNSESTVSDSLKNSVLAATKFPSKEVVKMDDNSYWVVGMLKKKDAQYHAFEAPQVKQGIIKLCKDAKREVELTKQIEKLHNEYNVVENTEYFENKKQNKANALNKAEQLVMQMQQQAAQEAGDLDDEEVDGILLQD